MRISDWSSDVCSADLKLRPLLGYGQDLHGIGFNPASIPDPSVYGPGYTGANYKSSDPYDSALNLNNRNRYEGGGGGLTIQYDLGFAKLVSTTGYRRYSFSTIADTDGSTDAAADLHLSQHRSAEHTSELQSLMRISYAVFC